MRVNKETTQGIKLKLVMESYNHEGLNNTKFRENPRRSCQKVVEMIWNDPIMVSRLKACSHWAERF